LTADISSALLTINGEVKMKIVFGIRLATLMLSCALTSVVASETSSQLPIVQIDVAVDVFALDKGSTIDDYNHILEDNRPEHSPKATATAGQAALITINTSANKGENVQVKFIADKLAVKYDLELVINESDVIANVAANDINNVLVFIADIKGMSKLIKVTTTIQAPEHSVASMAAAKMQLYLQRKKGMVEPDQHFFQWNKIWQTNDNMEKLLIKSKPRNHHHTTQKSAASHSYNFVYLTNNDDSRPIRGILKPKTKHNKTAMSFVVLPNKTIFLGEWSPSMRFNITDVSFLTVEEQNAISKTNAEQQLSLQRKKRMVEPDQHFFYWDKVWQTNDNMERVLKKARVRYQPDFTHKSTTRDRYNFVYITNNDDSRPIRGILKPATKLDKAAMSFVVLPNKTIFLGEWSVGAKFNMTDVHFLTVEETDALKTMKKTN
jgi:hypothetical protein